MKGIIVEDDGPTTKGVAILLDFENITFQARRDGCCKLRDFAVLDLLVKQAMESSSPGSKLIRADAALSVPTSRKSSNGPKRLPIPRDTARALQYLIDKGFTSVSLVKQGADSADWQIYRSGMSMVADERISKVVLCTGDGGSPFIKLVNSLLSAGKKVELIAYDRIAQSMKDLDLPFSLLVPAVRLASAAFPEKTSEKSDLVKLEESVSEVLATADSSQKKKVYVFRDVLRKIMNGSESQEGEDDKKFRSVVWSVLKEMSKDRLGDFSQHRLIDLSAKALKPSVSESEVKEIIFELAEHSDLFLAKTKFSLNSNAEILKKTKPI